MAYFLLLLKLIYFMLPAYFANMAPVFSKYIFSKQALSPIDFGIEVKGEPLLGKHKTIGGFLFGIIVALGIGYFQFLLYPRLKEICFVNYHNLWAELSFLMGLGAMTGDLVKSFFKRRLNLKAGKPWIPFDELDFVAGALIFVSPVYFIGWLNIALILLISLIGHIFINWLGFRLNLRKKREVIDLQTYLSALFKKWQGRFQKKT
jgi:CDP-2,3-bis-(O-geranylgeranyl)-sn-glycerol synthase